MNEMKILDLIRLEFRASGLADPLRGLPPTSREMAAWRRVAKRIANECYTECRMAARAASMAGFAITRGRTKL
jgi:hypothetical protein